MANLGAQIILRDNNAGTLDTVVNEAESGIGIGAGEVVDVIDAVCDVGRDLHPRGPRVELGEARVSAVAEAIGEAGAGDEFVDEEDGGAGDGGAEEFDEAAVVAAADEGEAATEVGEVELAAEGAAGDDGVAVAEGAAAGGGGEARGGEVGGGGGDLGEMVDVRVFRERVFEA